MDDAINARTKEHVQAEALVQRRGWRAQEFVCPGCRNPVQLRNGAWRAPHFAHLPGYDTEDCAYYHGGVGGGGGGGGASEGEPSPLPLYLQVRPGVAAESVWILQIAIPRTESSHGRITVVDGLSGRSRLSCSVLANGGKRVPVRPQESEYRIEVTSDVSPADAERMLVGSPGLDPESPSLFRGGMSGGRRLLEDDDLTWGESYFAIWGSTRPPEFPSDVAHQELADLGHGYRVGVFQLPLDSDEQVRAWVANALFRRVALPGVTLSVVSPLPLPGVEDELQVDSREEVVVGIGSPIGTHHLRDLTVVDDETGMVRRVPLKRGPRVLFVSIAPLGQRRVTVSVEDDTGNNEAELQLAGYQRPLRIMAAGVDLVASATSESGVVVVPLYSRAAPGLLTRIRDGEATLEDVRLPTSVSLQFKGAGEPQPLLSGDALHKGELLERARQFLADSRELEIDAASFGSARVPARLVIGAPVPRGLRLTDDVRRRIRALATLAAVEGPKARVFSLEPQIIERLTEATIALQPSDAVLVCKFARLGWYAGAIPQARALAVDVLRRRRYIAGREWVT